MFSLFHFRFCPLDLYARVSHAHVTPSSSSLQYPLSLIMIVLLSLLAISVVFEQHDVLVRVCCLHLLVADVGPGVTRKWNFGENLEESIRPFSIPVLSCDSKW